MSIRVMNHVWQYSAQKGAALLLLLAIADHAHDDGGGAYPSVDTLAKKVRMTPRNTQLMLRRLSASGELSIQAKAGPHHTNLYTVRMDLMHMMENPGVQTFQGENSSGVESSEEGDANDLGMVKNRVENCTENFTQTIKEPSDESSVEPSEELTFPIWWKTMSEDSRWDDKIDLDYIRDIDSRFGHLDLMFEARKCYIWLQGGKALAAKKKNVRLTFLNWVDRADRDLQAAEGTGKRVDAKEWIRRHGLPVPGGKDG